MWPKAPPASCPSSPVLPTPIGEACIGTHLGGGARRLGLQGRPGGLRPGQTPLGWQWLTCLGGRAASSRVIAPLAILWGTLWDLSELGNLVRGFW